MTQVTATAPRTCDPATRVTKSLLGYGVLAGPLYVTVSLVLGLTRPGFDLSRDQWSLLANGHLGWVQVANFLVTGAMTIAFAVGLRRATRSRTASTLIGVYGAGLIAAGIFRADEPGTFSWHGTLHLVCGGIGFLCLVAACLVLGRRYAREGRAGWARYSRITGVVFLAGFACVATAAGASWATLVFVGAVLAAWTWLAAIAIDHYRHQI